MGIIKAGIKVTLWGSVAVSIVASAMNSSKKLPDFQKPLSPEQQRQQDIRQIAQGHSGISPHPGFYACTDGLNAHSANNDYTDTLRAKAEIKYNESQSSSLSFSRQ